MLNTCIYKNGLKLIHEKPQSELPITSINIFCDYGSTYEKDGVRGAAHFIEHMCFKGTKKINNGKEIFLNYDKIGAYFNANTEKRYTRYKITCQDEYFKNCFYILSDMLMNSVFDKKEFNKELNVVVEENIRSEDDASDSIDMMMNRILYKGSSYADEIDSLSYHTKNKLEYEDMIEIYKMFYVTNRMIVSIVSNIPFSTIKSMIKDCDFFKKLKPSICDVSKYQKVLLYSPQSTIEYNITNKKGVTTTHLSIGFRTCNYYSKDKYVLNMISNIIGGNSSSKLFNILREENGLTYKSSCYTTYYENLGDIRIVIESNPQKILKNGKKQGVLPLIINILNGLIYKGITKEELIIFKNNIKGSMLLDIQNNESSAFHNGLETLMCVEKVVKYKDLYDEYYVKMNVDEVNKVLRKYLKKENMSVCIFGENVPSLQSVKKECENFLKN